MALANPDVADDVDSLSSSSSSSSDDEYLTIGGGSSGTGIQDREALIRKKLLESFYGKTAAASDDRDDDSSSSSSSDGSKPDASMLDSSSRVSKGNDDLDSPYFDAESHTSRHIVGSSVHTLLETEEQLALDVRTLDSTMQTLVYENYSKFIDATDAIRSIGVSVTANEDGLARLSRGMQTIDDQTRSVEESIGSLRDAVAEKLRVKRLLTRLDTLLKLPTTLKQHVSNGKYRLAAKSYLSASSILRKHSSGFESLKSIETECHAILTDMVRVLKRKVLYWSGRRDDFIDEDDEDGKEKTEEVSSGWVPPPEPPQTVSEIFECAGTLVMLLPPKDSAEEKDHTSFDSGISAEDCKSMALGSSLRLLDRILDSHHIDVQEAKFAAASVGATPTFNAAALSGIGPPSPDDGTKENTKGHNLIPATFLDSLLEAATLYGMSFSNDVDTGLDVKDRSRIVDFVLEAFSTFLGHVRMILLEQHMADNATGMGEGVDESTEPDAVDEEDAYGEVSAAMAHLLRSVRGLASGLALPEVGVDMEVASSLVDQTVEITEAMVRRRVAQEFVRLRIRVLKDCLGPFASEALAMPTSGGDDDEIKVVEVVQIASVALSDGMQLVDDVVRGILSGGVVVGSSATSVDLVKVAVGSSARQFALWLASTLEVLAGCENSDPQSMVEVTNSMDESETGSNDIAFDEVEDHTRGDIDSKGDDFGDYANQIDEVSASVDSTLSEILLEMEDKRSISGMSDLVLAIAEMCRLAERNVMDNINQSIDGVGKKAKSTGIFASADQSKSQPGDIDDEPSVSVRFRLAGSRVLAFYAVSQGISAASVGCEGMFAMACTDGDLIPRAPRAAAWQMLEFAKVASSDCSNVFGGEKRAGPVPELLEDDMNMSPLKRNITGSSSVGGHFSSLQLDVARMFAEKVAIYPCPSIFMEFSRNAVLTILFKVAFKAMAEVARNCTFSCSGYRQLQVDVELLRCMVPHFVSEDFEAEESNACNVLYKLLDDVVMNAGDRCQAVECVGVEEFFDPDLDANRTPRSIVREFMNDEENVVSRFTVAE